MYLYYTVFFSKTGVSSFVRQDDAERDKQEKNKFIQIWRNAQNGFQVLFKKKELGK